MICSASVNGRGSGSWYIFPKSDTKLAMNPKTAPCCPSDMLWCKSDVEEPDVEKVLYCMTLTLSLRFRIEGVLPFVTTMPSADPSSWST